MPLPAAIDLSALNGQNGYTLTGAAAEDQFGAVVTLAGDFNGDGLVDLLVSSLRVDLGGVVDAGAAYVIFGDQAPQPATASISSLGAQAAAELFGTAAQKLLGYKASGAGDFNGDGFDDVAVLALLPLPTQGMNAYVVFGRAGGFETAITPSTLPLASTLHFHSSKNTTATWELSPAGDFNGDGYDDLLVGSAGFNNSLRGGAFILFGGQNVSGALNVDTSLVPAGFQILPPASLGPNAVFGTSVAAVGDLNGDGLDDIMISAALADVAGRGKAGSAFVIFGKVRAAVVAETAAIRASANRRSITLPVHEAGLAIAKTDADVPPLLYHLTYRDTAGFESQRVITLQRIDPDRSGTKLICWCHGAKAQRCFSLDGIVEVFDVVTGEVHDDPVGFFTAHPMLVEPKDPVDYALRVCRHEINVLVAVGAADGRFDPDEQDRVLVHVFDRLPDLVMNEEIMRARLCRLAPDVGAFDAAMTQMSRFKRGDAVALLRSLRKLVDADGMISQEEAVFAEEVQAQLRNVTA